MKGIPTLWRLRQDGQLGDRHVTLYFWLRHMANGKNSVSVSTSGLADAMGWSRPATIATLSDLEKCGLVGRDSNRSGKRGYNVKISSGKQQVDRQPVKPQIQVSELLQPVKPQIQVSDQPVKQPVKNQEQLFLQVEPKLLENKEEPKKVSLLVLDSSLQEESSGTGEGATALGAVDASPSSGGVKQESNADTTAFFADIWSVLGSRKRR